MTSKRLDFLNRRRRVLYMRLRGAPIKGIAETMGLTRQQTYNMLEAARKDQMVYRAVKEQVEKVEKESDV